jgi:SPP1 gp7 family putative phage head morphogenesis protein
LSALTEKLAPRFGPVRAEMIGVTETTRIFHDGNVLAWRASGLVKGEKWQTSMDDLVCPICEPMHDRETALGEQFGDVEGPPAHVNCRCWVHPVVQEV